jgi:hypothetical protein
MKPHFVSSETGSVHHLPHVEMKFEAYCIFELNYIISMLYNFDYHIG